MPPSGLPLVAMGTSRKSVSAAQSAPEQEVASQERGHHITRRELTSISQTKSPESEHKPDVPDTLKWTKPTIFALGLVVAHQKKTCKNGHIQTDWKAVLPVINDIFPREFEGFNDIHPKGLEKAGKLRSQFSDHNRNRENKWLSLHPDKCTPEEIQEMTRMGSIVFETEQRLSKQRGSLVLAPGPNAPKWITFTVKPKPEQTAEKPAVRKRKRIAITELETAAKPAVQKRNREDISEPETEEHGDGDDHNSTGDRVEDKQADGNDNEEQESQDRQGDSDDNTEWKSSEEHAGDDPNDEEERSNDKHAAGHESSSASHGLTASYHDSDDDRIVVAKYRSRRVIVTDDGDGHTERASDEEGFVDAARAILTQRKKKVQRAKSNARQTHPDHKKSHLNEVHNVYGEDECDGNPAPSAYETGTYGNYVGALHNASNDRTVRLGYTAADLVRIRDQFLQTVDDSDLLPSFTSHKTGALDNAIIQSKAVAFFGNQDGLQIMPGNQKELLRRHRQNEMEALHYGEGSSLRPSGLAPSAYCLNPPRVYYGDGHTEHLPQPVVYSYSALRRTLMIAFQARRWTDVWDAIKRVPGFVEGEWKIIDDLIDNIVTTTGKSRADATEAVNIATHRQSISSLKLARLLALPIKINKRENAEPDGTLDNIVQQLSNQPKLQMIHTKDVDFTTEPPTCTFRKKVSGSGIDFRIIHSFNTLLEQTGEVRRVLLEYETTGQAKEIDVMLCDKTLCAQCTPSLADAHDVNFDYAEQRKGLPLAHHKDVAMFEDEKLYFVPMQQGPVLDNAAVVKRDIHEVVFGDGRASKVIFCDKALCGACQGKEVSCVADLVLPWRR